MQPREWACMIVILVQHCIAIENSDFWDDSELTLTLKSREPERVQLDPQRVPTARRPGRQLLDHTEMHNIQILQDIKAAEMAARAATFTYYPDVNDAQGPSRGCLQRQNLGGPICQNENPRVRVALNTLFHATNGYWWKSNMNWRTAENYCTWASVGCDDRDVLRSIHMDDNQLTDWYNASLPNELAQIESLYEFSMACNYLQGTIPPGLGNLTDLAYLDLHGNTLTGNQPHGLAKLQHLLYIDLSYNHLEGWGFIQGQPTTPWTEWGQLTQATGGGRLSSPTVVHMSPFSWEERGRIGTWNSVQGRDKNGTVPGVGGQFPIDDIRNSYDEKIPTSPDPTALQPCLEDVTLCAAPVPVPFDPTHRL